MEDNYSDLQEPSAGESPVLQKKRKSLFSRVMQLLLVLIIAFFFGSCSQVVFFKWIPPSYSNKMLQDQVLLWSAGDFETKVNYDWRSYNKISPYMILAVIASEDQKFPEHQGLDIEAIQEAYEKNKRGKRTKGASTITQQVAKNLFLWPGRNYLRKGLEAYYSLLIEILWSKKRIVEVYVNIAEMGPQTYGVQAASNSFYNKEAEKIRKSEAALLAAVLPNPNRYSAKRPSNYVLKRRNWIMRQMNQLGGVSFLENI